MSTTIGSLIAELGLDDSKYRAGLKMAHQDGLKTVINIEKDFKSITKLDFIHLYSRYRRVNSGF